MRKEPIVAAAALPSPVTPIAPSILTAEQFCNLAEVPPEIEWFANIDNAQTWRAYENDLHSFMNFVGIANSRKTQSDYPQLPARLVSHPAVPQFTIPLPQLLETQKR